MIEGWLPDQTYRILEIGCSWGYIIGSLGDSASFRFGVDINFSDVRFAQQRFGHNSIYLSSGAEFLPFADETFDAIIMSEVLEHTRDEERALAEAARVLRPGGVIVLTVPQSGPLEVMDLTNLKLRMPGLHRRFYGWKHRGDYSRFVPVSDWHRHYSLDQLRSLVSPYFEITAVRCGGFLLFALAVNFAALFKWAPFVSVLWRIAAADYSVSYGSNSYNIALRLRKPDKSS
jgi:ubiquinone/menaquinone biosynthesis C-methylase UbiE